jgi:capsule polysaccharide modification protein KpsS
MFTADFDAFNADNAPAYIRSAQVEGTDYGVEKTLKYTNESNVPNLLEGLSVMTLDAATGLAKVDTSVEIEVTIYKVVDGEKVEVEEINTQFPANGTAPEVQYVVDYVVTHNGQTDMVSRIYTLAE